MVDHRQVAKEAVLLLQKEGADAAEAFIEGGDRFATTVRLGQTVAVQQASSKGLGVRAFRKGAVGAAYTTDFSRPALRELARKALEIAGASSPDTHNALPPADLLGGHLEQMTLYDAELAGLSTDQRIRFAKEAEAAGLGFEQRVSGSEGANWTQAVREITIANSAGFVGHHQATSASLSIRVLAEDRGVKQTDFYFVGGRFLSDLGSPAAVGREAARRAVAKLGARNVKSQTVPVVVAPEAGTRFMHWISRAVSGQRVYGRATFLADKLGKQVMSPVVTIIDDPTLHRGPDSYPFDAEGVRAARTVLVQDGVLRGYLTDAYAARRLNMRLSGHATRTYRTTPEIGPSNLYLQKGAAKRQDLLKSVRSGLYLTEVFGTGFNNVTGDFSQGASGFWIEDGELAYPVQGITVAGNILNVLSNVQAVGDDLSFNRGAVTSPTLLVGALTLGGS